MTVRGAYRTRLASSRYSGDHIVGPSWNATADLDRESLIRQRVAIRTQQPCIGLSVSLISAVEEETRPLLR